MTVVNVILSRSKYLSLFFQDLIAELYPGSVQLNFLFRYLQVGWPLTF